MTFRSILLSIPVMLSLTACSYGVAPVDLANLDGWDIVVEFGSIPSVDYAAQELQSFIQQAGGPALPIVNTTDSPSKHMFVGPGTAMAASNVGFSV